MNKICEGKALLSVGRPPLQETDVDTWECIARDTCKHYLMYKVSSNLIEANKINAFDCMLSDTAYEHYTQMD